MENKQTVLSLVACIIILILIAVAAGSCKEYKLNRAEYGKCTQGMAGYGSGKNFTKTKVIPR